jgi:hypothetical protein
MNLMQKISSLALLPVLLTMGCSKSGTTPPPAATFDCNTMSGITTNTTFPVGVYDVTCSIDVSNNAILTIQPGTILNFEQGASLTVEAGASLNAAGTSAKPIAFKGAQSAKGWWTGIIFNSVSLNNVLSYCTISDAGATNASYRFGADITLDNATVSITYCTISNSQDAGINMAKTSPDYTVFNAFANNTVSGCGSYPIVAYAAGAGSVGSGNNFSGNANNYIGIRDQVVAYCNVNVTLSPQPVPYEFLQTGGDNGVGFAKNLTIMPGTNIVMASGIGLLASPTGSINAVGTATNKITIKGLQATAGFWDAICVQSNNILNDFENCVISDGGGPGGIDIYSANVGLLGTYQYIQSSRSIIVRNCSLSNSASSGIYLTPGGITPTYNSDIATSNTFSGCNPNVQY